MVENVFDLYIYSFNYLTAIVGNDTYTYSGHCRALSNGCVTYLIKYFIITPSVSTTINLNTLSDVFFGIATLQQALNFNIVTKKFESYLLL